MTAPDLSGFVAGWQCALPGLVVAGTAMLVMVVDLVSSDPDRDSLVVLAIVGLLAALGTALWL